MGYGEGMERTDYHNGELNAFLGLLVHSATACKGHIVCVKYGKRKLRGGEQLGGQTTEDQRTRRVLADPIKPDAVACSNSGLLSTI